MKRGNANRIPLAPTAYKDILKPLVLSSRKNSLATQDSRDSTWIREELAMFNLLSKETPESAIGGSEDEATEINE